MNNFCFRTSKTVLPSLRSWSNVVGKSRETRLWPKQMQMVRNFSTIPQQKSKETRLVKELRSRILSTGPITVADYMKEVLINPFSGYYMHRDVFGPGGDFVTAPEVSQMVGELSGVWFLNEWIKAGKPKPVYIVELGPGRGTLADDILRVFSHFPDARECVSLHLVEVSPNLSQIQELTLCGTVSVVKDIVNEDTGTPRRHIDVERQYKHSITKHGIPVYWYLTLNDVPKGYSCFMAHEFFDALPVHKFQKTANGWREVLIDVDNSDASENHLRYVLSRGATPASQFYLDPNETRDHVEISPESGVIMQDLGGRLVQSGGSALIVDYGHQGDKTDTFRAFKHHQLYDPLSEPGTADLTCDVDFSYLLKNLNGKVLTYGPTSQRLFLQNMGIEQRLKKLLQKCQPEQEQDLRSGYDMITNPEKMGERYKFFGLIDPQMRRVLTQDPPGGFV